MEHNLGEVCDLLHQKNRPWSVASKKLFFLMQEVMFHFLLDTIPRLKITDSRSPVMMTGQIFFSPDKPRFWPVKLMNIIIIFLPMEYRITLEVDRCTALSFKFLPASW